MPSEQDNIAEKLASFDLESSSDISEDVRFRILDVLSNPALAEMLSELSNNEIKRCVKAKWLGIVFDDEVSKGVVDDFILLKVSKERKGRHRIEEMGISKSMADYMAPQKEGIWSRFKGKVT